MTELSVFVYESGDFGEYEKHAPYYIITLVMHNQAFDIEEALEHLEADLSVLGYPNHCVHTGPIIRGEQEYRYVDIFARQKIMKRMMSFARRVDINYKSFFIEKIRDYNITKREWVLDGDTVSYGHALDLKEPLEYDLSQERNFRYNY